MRAPIRTASVALAAATLAACSGGSSKSGPTASGKLTPAELSLLASVPAGGHGVYGGDALAVLRWIGRSPLARLTQDIESPQLLAFLDCLAAKPRPGAGQGTVAGGAIIVRTFVLFLTVEEVEACGRSAGATVTGDVDGRFATVAIEVGGRSLASSFLGADGGVHVRTALPVAALGGGLPPAATREALEADVAALGNANAALDTRFHAALEALDRRRTLWFAGDGTGSEVDGMAGAAHGTVDVARGLGLDVSVTLRPDGTAASLHERYAEGRRKLEMLPVGLESVKAIARATTLRRRGEALHLVATYSEQMLGDVVDLVAGRRRRR